MIMTSEECYISGSMLFLLYVLLRIKKSKNSILSLFPLNLRLCFKSKISVEINLKREGYKKILLHFKFMQIRLFSRSYIAGMSFKFFY